MTKEDIIVQVVDVIEDVLNGAERSDTRKDGVKFRAYWVGPKLVRVDVVLAGGSFERPKSA